MNYVNRTNESNLTNQTELFVNFKRTELELKKGSYETQIEFRAESVIIESSQVQLSSTRLDSFLALSS